MFRQTDSLSLNSSLSGYANAHLRNILAQKSCSTGDCTVSEEDEAMGASAWGGDACVCVRM